jgi:hypothetical protein
MSLQTSYSENMPVALVGQPAIPDYEADSRIVETAAGIGFGLAVSRGTGERGVVLGGTQFAGISLRDITIEGDTADEYADKSNIGVMVKGQVWVNAVDAVDAGDDVYFDNATGALSNAGDTKIDGAVWESSALAGGLAKVRLGGVLPSAAPST